jgi:hypothetical protein
MSAIYPVGYVDAKASLIKQIDADTDAIYLAVQGNRSAEYILTESDANTFKAGGYLGVAPSSVQSWATAKGWTTTQSADDIIATATAWRSAQAQIRATRLLLKEQAKVTSDIDLVQAQWVAFRTTVKTALGVS